MPRCQTLLSILASAVALLCNLAATSNAEQPMPPAKTSFVHPGIAHGQGSIAFIKAKLNGDQQPWKDAWAQLNESKLASLEWSPSPRAHVERGAYNRPDIGGSDFSRDGSAAYTHAIHWALSGDEAHARKSAEIIDAWSRTLKTITNHDAKLLVGMVEHQYCNAAELLRHTWNGWPEDNQRQFQSMLRDVWYPVIKDFYPSANGNWDASMLQTMIAMGVYLDDRAMFDRAVTYFRDGKGNGAIGNYFNEFGECQESGRDQGHTQMGLEFLANTCETAWNQNVDLYGALDNRLLTGFEYTAKYNLGFDVPYEPFKSFEGRYRYTSLSNKSRGRLRPMYQKVLNHYHHRQGMDAPFTAQAVSKTRAKQGRGGSSLPWGTLMFASQPAIDHTLEDRFESDIVVYGGTASAVVAAVQAKKMGKSVILVGPDKHLGGLTSGGLGFTDTGNKAVIGGLSRDFYHRIWKAYQAPAAWRWQPQSEYGNKGQGTPAIDGENRTMWIFEPHVAERVFEDYVKEFQIPVFRNEWLDRAAGVKKEGGRVISISVLSGKTFVGKMFIDATYEGDLLAAAGVDYHVGREANTEYGENWNGVQTGVLHHRHHFGVLDSKISPYVLPGDPNSGVLPRISVSPPGEYGSGDKRVQAYCYRYCATNHPENRVPFPKPEGYDPKQYELLLRIYEAGWRETFDKFDPIPNRKSDTNNHGPFSTDNIGMSYDYPEASYEQRQRILDEHRRYQQGWLYFVANDPRVPRDVQLAMQQWGLAEDEFTDNDNWPHQIYVREARRMVGKFVMTENELTKRKPTPDPIGMGSYTIDSHNVQRYITPEGYVQNEGDIGIPISPYTIAYGSLVPKRSQCENLLVSVCVSSSHIAFGSIRMEPVFMILGQSAATGAVLALDLNLAVQDVPYRQLRQQLLSDGQVLEHASARANQPQEAEKQFIDSMPLP